MSLIPGTLPLLGPNLEMQLGVFTEAELRKAILKMPRGKATKIGDIPIECFKAFAEEGPGALQWMTDFCNSCWNKKELASEWVLAKVALIYKKNDPSHSENYRPISLRVLLTSCLRRP